MDIVDILIHVHPDLTKEQRATIEETVSSNGGVVSVHFSTDHTHELTVAYDPQMASSDAVLEQVRQWDKDAVMAGL